MYTITRKNATFKLCFSKRLPTIRFTLVIDWIISSGALKSYVYWVDADLIYNFSRFKIRIQHWKASYLLNYFLYLTNIYCKKKRWTKNKEIIYISKRTVDFYIDLKEYQRYILYIDRANCIRSRTDKRYRVSIVSLIIVEIWIILFYQKEKPIELC